MEKKPSKYFIKNCSKHSIPHVCPKCGAKFDSIMAYTEHRSVCYPFRGVPNRGLPPILQALAQKQMIRKRIM